ncbi:MAG: GNAT family N-acetyltransferase [Agitococcus sp.]|nr:GNAT family N-acetyltransferase [Agitococcus sp.]
MEIRTAILNDAPHIAPLIYSAGPELYDFIYKTEKHTASDFIAYEFRTGKGFCGYRNVSVVAHNGRVVATGCFFDGKQFKSRTLQTLINMFKFYGPIQVWAVLGRSKHVESVMKQPKNGELYLSNFGVQFAMRGQGFGSALIKYKINEAKKTGYKIFSLDVASTNPRAESLYNRLGLKVVKQKQFSGKRTGISVPDARKMELLLTE